MTTADALNIAAFVATAFGSSLGMFGIFKQTNPYYPFKAPEFLEHLYRVGRAFIAKGKARPLNSCA
jgi:hypothetical protein